MVMEKDYKEHITADSLFEDKQIGSTTIYPIEGGNCRYIGIKARCGYRNQSITDVYIYDNNNVLIEIKDINNSRTLYQIVNERTSSSPYKDISLKVFDGKYRVAYTDDRVCVISEEIPHKTISETKWKEIIDINNDIAIVNSRGNYYNLVRLNFNTNWSNELQGSKEIVYLNNYLYKFRNIETGSKYQLYNAGLPRESNPKTLYDDIQPISEQMAVGIKTGVQWDFIKINSTKNGYLEVAYTSYKEPVFHGDTINLVELDDYGNEIPYTINKWGTKLSEEPEEGFEEPVVETKAAVLPHNGSETAGETTIIQDETISIGKFIVVTDDSARKSENGNYVFCNYSYKKACKCEGFPCWILIKQKLMVITEKQGKVPRRLRWVLIDKLPDEFEQFTNISEDNKWLYFEDTVTTSKKKIKEEAIHTIAPKLRKLSEERKVSFEVQQKRDIEDTKDILRLKAIYDFLKLQGFEKTSIYDAASSLFPEIEAYIDYTNVKQNYYYGWKRYVENVEKLKKILPNGYIDENRVIGELRFSDKEKTIFDYYTNVKEYPVELAIECIQEESPTGEELRKEYETLMRLDDIVDNQRKILQREIMDDLIHNFTAMVDTSELLKTPGASNTKIDNNATVVILPKSTDFRIKEEKHVFKINESIRYDLFERKRFHYYEKPIYYLAFEKHVVILLNCEKARELDKGKSRQFKIRGNGDDKKFDQDYSAINGIIANQRDNNARIYVFECIDNETCRFFDELQCIKHELVEDENESRKVIFFTMKSLLRYNTDNY
jgi:hypothetical protein